MRKGNSIIKSLAYFKISPNRKIKSSPVSRVLFSASRILSFIWEWFHNQALSAHPLTCCLWHTQTNNLQKSAYLAFQCMRFVRNTRHRIIPQALTLHFHPYLSTSSRRLFSVTLSVFLQLLTEILPVRKHTVLYCPDFPPRKARRQKELLGTRGGT